MTSTLLERTVAELERHAVRWAVLREPLAAGGAGRSGDVDLLVDPADANRVGLVLRELGYRRLASWGRGAHRFFLTYDLATDEWLELDVVTELAFGPAFSLATDVAVACLDRRVAERSGPRLAPDDRFWALLLHAVLDRGRVRAGDLDELAGIGPEAMASRGPLREWLVTNAGHALVNQLQSAAIDRRADELAALRGELLVALARRRPWSVARRLVSRTALRAAERPLQLRQRVGLAIALLGPDGAGKSSLAEGLEQSLPFPVRRVYMGLWPSGEGVGAVAHSVRVAVRPLAVWVRYGRGLVHRLRGRLVVFDRYTYDALLPPTGRWTALKRIYFAVLARSCPRPDLVLVLDAPGTELHARKGESSPERLESERQTFARLRDRLPEVELVDATAPAGHVRRLVTEQIWRRYARRLEGGDSAA